MDRVPDFESVGCGFDPRRGYYTLPREVSVQIGATQPAQDEHFAHLKHVLHVHPFFTLCLEPLYQKCPLLFLIHQASRVRKLER
jgi:hypothetical protein